MTAQLPELNKALLNDFQHFVDQLENKDLYTQGHSHHVMVVVQALYHRLPVEMTEGIDLYDLSAAALLHDIGKIEVSDKTLNKEGALDETEWEEMRQHPKYGAALLEKSEYSHLCQWVLLHHERLDGKGYYGIEETELPFAARLIAVADTFSALRTYRIYRSAKSISDTRAILQQAVCDGQLDERITECLLTMSDEEVMNLECCCPICRQRRMEETGMMCRKVLQKQHST